jgi:hypothetical protein
MPSAMARVFEVLIGIALLGVLFAPLVAIVAGAVVLLTGAAFFPVFMPLTTLAVAAVIVWQAWRARPRKRPGGPK